MTLTQGAVPQWRDISTAPKDGTRILITDGKRFTAASWTFYEERPTVSLGYGEKGIPAGGWPRWPGQTWSTERVPNPKAGERTYYWHEDNPVAFSEDDEDSPDYDGNFERMTPTHWMPLPPPPEQP